jgi:hypothetical protein
MENQLIPKRIFFYWQNDSLSWMRYMTLYSFRKLNPDWQIDLFYFDDAIVHEKQWKTLENQDYFTYIGKDYFDKIHELNINIKKWEIPEWELINLNPVANSDVFRWYELCENGGIYSDMDILFIKPIDGLFNTLISGKFDTMLCLTEYLSIGFLASTQHNSLYKDVYNNCLKIVENDIGYQSFGVCSFYDLFCTDMAKTNVLSKKYPELNIYNLPFKTVYPFDSFQIEDCFTGKCNISQIPEETIGYHWYAGHPLAQKYNSILTEKNYNSFNNLFCELVKKYHNEK